MLRYPVLLAAMALISCYAGDAPSLVDEYAGEFDTLANAVCKCDYRALHMPQTSISSFAAMYASVEECRADLPTVASERACLSELYAAETALEAALECRRDMFTAITDCLEGSECDGSRGLCYSTASMFGCVPLDGDLEDRLTACLH